MAKVVQKHGWQVLLAVATAVILVLGWWGQPRERQAQGQNTSSASAIAKAKVTPKRTLDAATYSRLQQLREDLALTNVDLATLGCTQAQAEGVLDGLVTWYDAHQAALTQMEQAERQAQNNLQETMRLINVGPRDESRLALVPGLHQNVMQAHTQRKELVAAAGTAVLTGLSSSQQQTRQRLETKRHPQASRTTSKLAGSLNAANALTAEATLQEAAAAQATVAQALPGVLQADAICLPLPAELQLPGGSLPGGQLPGATAVQP